jgi:OOP family OmpA-OmpF porin
VVVTKEVIREVVKEVPTEVIKEVVKESKEELAITLYFNLNSTTYTSATAIKAPSEIAALRAKYPNAEILVVGNTDESGSSTYNYNLGLARAQKVANYLMAKTGLDETKIVVRSDGKVRPQSDKKEDNRRVDVYIILDK